MISTFRIIFGKKKSVLLCILEDYRQFFCFFLQKQYLRGSSGLHLPAARGEELRGNVNTVTLDKPSGEKLQRASPCFYLKGGQRRLKSDCTCSLLACCCGGLPRTHTLSRGSARFQDILIKSQWFLSERAVMCCTLLCEPESNGLANASACNGGCQHHLHSIDPAPTWGRTIRACLW